jgi:adenine-specific DNA-methyltransferase
MRRIEAYRYEDASRKNIPTAEFQSVMDDADLNLVQIAYERRNKDLDPQLVWRGKDQQDWSDLIVTAPPLYIQEKIHPKVLIDDLTKIDSTGKKAAEEAYDLFADFNDVPENADKTEFYQHDGKWQNRMILGDSLLVMASLAEREGLRGKVQCIYLDPPYGIKFNSNFQWSTTSRDVKDGNREHITREPEMVKAFRDTWKDGIHSYLTYLRDRFLVARDLLTDSGSIFVQIGDENVHRVRALLDEVFGDGNFVSLIALKKSGTTPSNQIANVTDWLLWYGKSKASVKFRRLFRSKNVDVYSKETSSGHSFVYADLQSAGETKTEQGFLFHEKRYLPRKGYHWSTSISGLNRLAWSDRVCLVGNNLRYQRFLNDFPLTESTNVWEDVAGVGGNVYVVQTPTRIVERCVLMTTDPGDLVLDPTCGSGTTATVAEQWGRRWITIDTSRVSLALARARIMGAKYPYYLLADSPEGKKKEGEVTRSAPSISPSYNQLHLGFVYQRVPHITLKSIANNVEIDVIWEKFQQKLEPLRASLNTALNKHWEEWEIPSEADDQWSDDVKAVHSKWWELRINRQKEIDASIAAKADTEFLYDKPYEDKSKVRVAGPFTVESLMPHKTVDFETGDFSESSSLTDSIPETNSERSDFATLILENLKAAGVQQSNKSDKIDFVSIAPFPGRYICGEGTYQEADKTVRAAIFIGPEYGTVSRPNLVESAREAAESGFDVLIACAFNFDAHSTDLDKIGKIPILKARMNADLHMAEDLKSTGKGNLFVIFGEPDVELKEEGETLIVKIKGVDVFDPRTGEVRSDDTSGIACWFIDTNYNQESFFVRQAYFLGANDPYKSLRTTLKAEINEEAWSTLNSDTSRPFKKPTSGRIAVKVINHLGDEVMKVYKV